MLPPLVTLLRPATLAYLAAAALPALATEAPQAPVARIEAQSAHVLAVGTVRGNRMAIHLSQREDNAPVHDAALSVTLRGSPHPAVAEADGSYALETPDLGIPGSAAVIFHVTRGPSSEDLFGTLTPLAGAATPKDKNSARQLWWWVLNFAVCIGFLKLWTQRRKKTSEE